MLARQPKRARSPTPPPSQAYGSFGESSSPLDNVFLKRRRQAASQSFEDDCSEASYMNGQDPWISEGWTTSLDSQPEAGPSYSRPGRERRRAKQWEMLNAPVFGRPHSPLSTEDPNRYSSRNTAGLPSQQAPSAYPDPRLSGIVPVQDAFSTQQPGEASTQQLMSSSPVRHTAPTSSPFRDSGQSSQMMNDDWDPDELGKAWGEEYGSQNMLLRSLHRARLVSHTPDSTFLQTPGPSQRPDPFRAFDTPSESIYPTETPPHARPGLPRSASSASSNLFPTPYRHGHASSYFPSSSPYVPNPHSVETPSRSMYEADMMDVGDHEGQAGEVDDPAYHTDVGRRYEEANRLLAELEVARRQRTS